MMGYGPEDNHFVVELTYNYGVKNYKKGNDFQVCYSSLLQLLLWSSIDFINFLTSLLLMTNLWAYLGY